MTLAKPRQWEPLAAIPIGAGLFWLLAGSGGDWVFWTLVLLPPGALMLMSGMALLLLPGDVRITEYMAAGGFLGLALLLPMLVGSGLTDAFVAGLGAAATFLASGYIALAREPSTEGAPPPEPGLWMDAKTALDEALLAYLVGTSRLPGADEIVRIGADARRVEELVQQRGWAERPEALHATPPAPERVYVQQARVYGWTYERVSYPSTFVPDPELPGAEVWAQHQNNRQAVGWVLRHPGAPRPWLVCVHGYRMGEAWLDFLLFPPRWLHERLGLNVFMPVLPMHGPRRVGLRSGDHYLDGNPLDLLYAQTQALWDLRRGLAWLRSQEDSARIGVLGYSLGGYNAALLSQYDDKLDFVIAGIPPSDLAAALWRHIPQVHRDYFAAHGLDLERYRRLLQPVSPLARAPKLERERLYLFAGAADRLVLPDQTLALARHWQVPVQWYQGTHLTFRRESVVRMHIEAAMQRAGWPVSAHVAAGPQEDWG
ncbi:MAG: alpha/beta hydrolase family protein [Nevskiaceae bacterium]